MYEVEGCLCSPDSDNDTIDLNDLSEYYQNFTAGLDAEDFDWWNVLHVSTVVVSTLTILLNTLSMLAMMCIRAAMSANLRIISSLTLSDLFSLCICRRRQCKLTLCRPCAYTRK